MNKYQEVVREQREEAWFNARRTRLTASYAGTFWKTLKNGNLSQVCLDLIDEIAINRFDQDNINQLIADDYYQKKPLLMEKGIVGESYAREFYSRAFIPKGHKVVETGLLVMNDYDFIAASPDGLVLDKEGNLQGLIEIKTLTAGTFFNAKTFQNINPNYYYQIQHQLLVTGAKWCDFVGFRPEYEATNMITVFRIFPDEEHMENYLQRLISINTMIENKVESLKQKSEKNVNVFTEANSRSGINFNEFERLAKEIKFNYTLYSGFGNYVVNRDELGDSELLDSVPTVYELKRRDQEIINEYLKAHPEYKRYPTRNLKWKALHWFNTKQLEKEEQSYKEQNNFYAQLLGGEF